MRLSWIRFCLTHPSVLIAYLLRKRRLCQLLEVDQIAVAEPFKELQKLQPFKEQIALQVEKDRVGESMLTPMRAPILYMIIRLLHPSVVVETGVSAGVSSAFILKAFDDNKNGLLYSIDLPNQNLPKGKETGYLIPQELRERWSLIIGSSSEKLPTLLKDLGEIDLFLHDSEHTYENMMFEFNTAWQYIKPGGILISDDITWNTAFDDFCKLVAHKPVKFYGLGGLRKKVPLHSNK